MPKLFNKLMNLNDNNIETLNNFLQENPMHVELWRIKTKSGYRYAKVKVLGFAKSTPASRPAPAPVPDVYTPENQMPEPEHDPFKDTFDLF